MTAPHRATVHPAAEAPEVVAARAWVAQSGFADDITVTDAGRLRCYGLELDPATFLAMDEEEALDLLLQATIRAELGDDPGDLEP
jgi:hypothetical protein